MERLTERDPAGNAYFPECFKEPCGGGGCTKDHCEFFDQVCDKLAGYEEQGEQAEKLLAESEAARADLGKRLAAAEKELHEAKSELEQIKAERLDAEKTLQFISDYSFEDNKRIYTNGSSLVPLFRVKQALFDKAYNGFAGS